MARVLVASDNFDSYADGTLDVVGSANWRDIWRFYGRLQVVGGQTLAGNDTSGGSRWIGAGTFTADQYAKAVCVNTWTSYTNEQRGVILRASTDYDDAGNTTRDAYHVFRISNGDQTAVRITKVVNGTTTTLANGSSSFVAGDTIEGEAEGTTIRAMKNGAAFSSPLSATDSDLASGNPGIYGRSGAPGQPLDSWEAGNLVADGQPFVIGPTRIASRGVGAQVQRYMFRQPVVFSRGLAIYALALNSGAYTITGAATQLLHAALMNAVAGAYTISGQSASVLRGALVGATAGSYVVSGLSSSLLLGRKIGATAGSYNVSGVSATALRQALLALSAGGYNITGASATLVYTPTSSSSTSSLYIDLNNGHLIWRLL